MRGSTGLAVGLVGHEAKSSVGGESALESRYVKVFFDLLGVLLSIYVVACVLNGSVIVRSGIGARTLRRNSEPNQYWLGVGIYALLAVALITVF